MFLHIEYYSSVVWLLSYVFMLFFFYLQLWFHLQHVMVDEFLLHGKCKYFRISASLEIMHNDVNYSPSYFGAAVMLEDK